MKEWFTSHFIYFSKTHFRHSNPLITKLYDASDRVKMIDFVLPWKTLNGFNLIPIVDWMIHILILKEFGYKD